MSYNKNMFFMGGNWDIPTLIAFILFIIGFGLLKVNIIAAYSLMGIASFMIIVPLLISMYRLLSN
jgi:hypothetical protein